MISDGLAAVRLFDVAGKSVLVTGGSSGIGLMIACAFAANGARVAIVGRNPERLAAAAERIGALGHCKAHAADIATEEGVEEVAMWLETRGERLDVLVNNAGASWGAAFADFPSRGFDKVIDVNLKAPFFLTQRLLGLFGERAAEDWARIVNVSSVAARTVNVDNAAYGAAKAGLEHLTRILARALAPRRIAVNGIAPGWFPSRMNAPIAESAGPEWLAATPMARFGTAEDAGGLALFLASRAGAYVNGQTITLDGGRTI